MRIIIECPDQTGDDAVVTLKNLQSVAIAQSRTQGHGLVSVLVLDHKPAGRISSSFLDQQSPTREEAARQALDSIVGMHRNSAIYS